MKNYLVASIKLLRPTSEFSFTEDDYSTIKWDILEGAAPTKAEIETEIAKIKADEINEIKANATAKTALLQRLGITADEAALLLR